MKFNGYFQEKPTEREHYIEIIGDSLTCGYGNLCPNGTTGEGMPMYEDGTVAYPFLVAEKLGADCSVIGHTGIGLTAGWPGYGTGSTYDMLEYYPQHSYSRDKTTAYAFDRVPDVVIVSLGTNDNDFPDIATEAAMKRDTKLLVQMVRESYGTNVPIVWVYDFMAEGRYPWIMAAMNEMGGEAAGLYMFHGVRNNAGGVYHPDAAGHKANATALVDYIREKHFLK